MKRNTQPEISEDGQLLHGQKAVKQSEAERQHLYDLFMQAPTIIVILRGPEHVFELANLHSMEMVGKDRDIIGKPIRQALPELEGQGYFELLDEVYQTGQPFTGNEMPVKLDRKGNGKLEEILVNFVCQPYKDAKGNIERILIHAVDVTEQVRARQKVEASEKRQAFLLQLNDGPGTLSDPVAILETTTRTAMQYFGADRCYYCEVEGGNAIVRRDASRENLPTVVGVYPLHSFALFQAVVDAGHPIIVEDVHTSAVVDEELKQICIQLQLISFADVPVIKNGQAVGIFCLVQSTPRIWTDLEVALAIETAERTWTAVERAKAEELLQKSEKRLLLATDAAKMGTFIYYPNEDRGDPDTQMLALYGLPPDDTLNLAKALADIIHPDDRERYASEVAQAINPDGDGKLHSDIRIIHPDGSVHWMDVTAQVQFEGNPRRAVSMPGVSIDITERKLLEKNLAFLAEVSGDLAYLTNVDETMERLGEKIGHYFGLRWCMFSEFINDGETVITSYGWNDENVPSLKATYRMRDYLTEEQLAKNNAGELSICSDTRTDPHGNAESYGVPGIRSFIIVPLMRHGQWRFLLSIIDTKPRQWQQEEVELIKEIATRIWNRLERARAEEALQKALRHKDEFISIATHELKTPVTSMKAFLQVTQNRLAREGNEKAVVLLSKMDAQMNKLIALIADLVDVTKIEGGKLQFHEEYFPFDELVDETIEEVQRTTEKHTIVQQGRTGTTVFADRGRIGQVIINLLINAMKYSPHAEKVIVALKADDNAGVTLCIQDFGIGIPKAMQEKVFERFFRVEGEHTETFAGLGIGLFVAAEIIKRQGGSIWVESEEGKGSTFCFCLPSEGSKGKRRQEDTFVKEKTTHEEENDPAGR